MSEEQDASEKEHEATPRRLEQAREKGDAPKLADVLAAVAVTGHVLALALFGGWIMQYAGPVLTDFLARPDQWSQALLSPTPPLGPFLVLGAGALPLLGLPVIFVIGVLAATRGARPIPENLVPKLSRISLLGNARNKFGRGGLFEFGKSTAKLGVISVVLFWFLSAQMPQIAASAMLPDRQAVHSQFALVLPFLSLIVLLSMVIAGLDHLWQRAEFQRRNRMSRKELMDEMKDTEGDPHTKAKRRQRGIDIASNRMLADVPKASVVIVNPTHYAVALQWDPASGRAPVCLAKGVDEVAARIRERATAAGVPIHSDPPTARALHAVVDLGEEIRPEHYRAVAAAVRFAERVRKLRPAAGPSAKGGGHG